MNLKSHRLNLNIETLLILISISLLIAFFNYSYTAWAYILPDGGQPDCRGTICTEQGTCVDITCPLQFGDCDCPIKCLSDADCVTAKPCTGCVTASCGQCSPCKGGCEIGGYMCVCTGSISGGYTSCVGQCTADCAGVSTGCDCDQSLPCNNPNSCGCPQGQSCCPTVEQPPGYKCLASCNSTPTYTYNTCENNKCVPKISSTPQTSTCSRDSDCKTTHRACRNGSCVTVTGSGSDECDNDSDCNIPPTTKCNISTGKCDTNGSGPTCSSDSQCCSLVYGSDYACRNENDCDRTDPNYYSYSGNFCGNQKCCKLKSQSHYACNKDTWQCYESDAGPYSDQDSCEQECKPCTIVSFNFTPSKVFLGRTTTADWTTLNCRSCEASCEPSGCGNWSGEKEPNPSRGEEIKPTAVGIYDYTLSCENQETDTSATSTVKVEVYKAPIWREVAPDLGAYLWAIVFGR